MSIESLAPYSPDTVYGKLTSPFKPPKITINAHTSLDNTENIDKSEVYSRAYFNSKPQAQVVDLEQGSYEVGLNTESTPQAEVTNFSASKISSNSILRDSLKQGYSTEEAVIMQNAYNAYSRSSVITSNPVSSLSRCSYKVS